MHEAIRIPDPDGNNDLHGQILVTEAGWRSDDWIGVFLRELYALQRDMTREIKELRRGAGLSV